MQRTLSRLKLRSQQWLSTLARLAPAPLGPMLLSQLDGWVFDGKVKAPGADFSLLVHRRQMFLLDTGYERGVFEWLSKNVRPSEHCIDVGAHIGRATILMALLAGEKGQVDAIEPLPENCTLLRCNLARNRVSQTVRVWEACCCAFGGERELYIGPSSFQFSLSRDFQMGKLPARALTLDSLADGASRIGVIKIDVEGAEREVLEGAAEVLRFHRPKILAEMHPPLAGRVPELLVRFRYAAFDTAGSALDLNQVAARASNPNEAPFHVAFLPEAGKS